MGRLLAVMLMLTGVAVCSAQTWRKDWAVFYDARVPRYEGVAAVAPAKDGGAYSLNTATNYPFAPPGPIGGYQLIKFDSSGNPQWTRMLDLEDDPSATFRVVEGATGVFVAASVDRMFSIGHSILIVKYDFFGQQQWMRYYSLAPGYNVLQLVVDGQDDPVVLAESHDVLGAPSDWLIVRYDATGAFSWVTHPNVVANTQTTYISTDGGQNVYASGCDSKGSAWLTKLDKAGLTQWSYVEAAGAGAQSPPYFAVAPDTTIWFACAYTNSAGGGITYLRKISAGGQLLASSHVDYPGLNKVITDRSGNAYLFSNDTRYDHLPLAKFSANGTPLWQKPVLASASYDGFVDPSGNINILETSGVETQTTATQVEQFDANGNFRWRYSLAPEGFASGRANFDSTGIVSGGSGTYTTTANVHTAGIQKITTAGTIAWSYSNITHDHLDAVKMSASTSSTGVTYFAGDDSWLGAYDTNAKLLFAKHISGGLVHFVQACPGGGVLVAQTSLCKYDNAGNLVWSASFAANAAVFDSSGSIYCTNDVTTGKISPSGTILWTADVGGTMLRLDPFGNVILPGPVKLTPTGSIAWSAPAPRLGLIIGRPTVEADSFGNLYSIYNYYTSGTTYGAVKKYTPSGGLLWQADLGFDLNCPMLDSVMDRTTNTLYVSSTTYSGVYQATVFAVDCNSNAVKWGLEIPVANESHGTRILLNKDNHPVVAGDCHDLNNAFDYYVAQLKPQNGQVEQASRFDSGYRMNDRFDTFGLDSNGNAYVCGRSIGPTGTYNFNIVKYVQPSFDDAVLAQSAKSRMIAGSVYPVTVTATNIGKDTWTKSEFILDCLEPSTWGISHAYLDTNEEIGPNGFKKWVINVSAPTTPGTYTLSWQMEKSATRFGLPSPTLTITVVPQPNAGAYISQTVPDTMASGQAYPVSVQYKNTSTRTWYPSQIRLQSMWPQDNLHWNLARLPLISGAVAPGAIGTFGATLIGPEDAGAYSFQWQPIDDSTGLNFGNASPLVTVQVVTLPDAARYLSRTGPTTVLAGADFYIQNTMLNVGTNKWLSSGGYSMMTINPNNDSTWMAIRAYMPGFSTVTPYTPATFTALCCAPITPGTYAMQWQCDKNGVPFGQPSPLLTISVLNSADNAQFLSQTPLPTNVGMNTTFGVTLTMKNIGTATWDSSYGLVSVGNSSFGVASIPSSIVPPGATATFTGTFVAPAAPGTYTFQWRMAHNGTKFGQRTAATSIIVSPDAGVYVTKNVPSTVYAGQDFWIQFTMKNTGSTTWTLADGYTMMSVSPLNNTTWTINRLYMPGGSSIAPGQTVTFSGLATAPLTAKTYAMQWQLDRNGIPFGDITPFINVNVVAGPDNAQYVSQLNVATTIQHGAQFDASVTMKNIGTASWGAGYTLVPVGSSNFGVGSIGAFGTAPGSTCTFSQRFTAPATPGKYTFQWRMAHNGVKFGQRSISVTVTVT